MPRHIRRAPGRAQSTLEKTAHKSTQNRLEVPEPQVLWVGNKTILRNYAEYPKLMRRDPDRLLMYLAKELATAASLDGDRAIFIGRKDKHRSPALPAVHGRQRHLPGLRQPGHSHRDREPAALQGLRGVRCEI